MSTVLRSIRVRPTPRLGVVIFSGSLPATRVAPAGFAPLFLNAARAVIAGAIGALLLTLLRETRRLGGWQVISCALVLALPPTPTTAMLTRPATFADVGNRAWVAPGHVSLISMPIGFVFWYRSLALGGIAKIGQVQLLQPFPGLALAAGLFGEPVAPSRIVSAMFVVARVIFARKYA